MKFSAPLRLCSVIFFFATCIFPAGVVAQSSDSSQPQNQAPQTSSARSDNKQSQRPHRVITNDDIPSRTVPNSTPGTEARLEQLNQCDHACFAQVFKDSQLAFRQRYNYPYPFSSKDDHAFEDAIVNRLTALRKNAEWQTLLRNALLGKEYYCKTRDTSSAQAQSGKPITARDIAEEESRPKPAERHPNYGEATSAIIKYKFAVEQKDPLLAAIVLYKYFEIVKADCSGYSASE
jgi:hypothetical protein